MTLICFNVIKNKYFITFCSERKLKERRQTKDQQTKETIDDPTSA